MVALLVAGGVFLIGAGLVLGGAQALMKLPAKLMQRRIQARMDDVARHLEPEQAETFNIVKSQVQGAMPAIDRFPEQFVEQLQLRGRKYLGSARGRICLQQTQIAADLAEPEQPQQHLHSDRASVLFATIR